MDFYFIEKKIKKLKIFTNFKQYKQTFGIWKNFQF